jgi:serine/threonine protein kinase
MAMVVRRFDVFLVNLDPTVGSEIKCAKIKTATPTPTLMVWPTGHPLQNGKYTLEGILGKGGFGITYKAHHIELDDRVVIKTTYEYKKNNPKYDDYVRQFVREGQKMAQLSR